MANIRRAYEELPVLTSRVWDTVRAVQGAIQEHDDGRFYSSAHLVDAMWTDDRISGVQFTRINSLLGLPLALEPLENSSESQAIVDELEDGAWDAIFPRDQLAELLRWGQQLGVGLAQILWDTSEGQWMPRIQVWHPEFLSWNWEGRCFTVTTQDRQNIDIHPGDPQWLLYAPHGEKRGWIRGLVRSLALVFLVRRYAYRDWARYSEVHGSPIKKAIVPPNTAKDVRSKFLNAVAVLGKESTVLVERGSKDMPSFDVELLEAMSNTYEGFEHLISKADDAIAIAILGQNLTTEVTSGSLAAAQMHEKVRSDFLRFDSESLAFALREQVLVPWIRFNQTKDLAAARELVPNPRWQTEPPEDLNDKTKAWLQLGQAFGAFNAAGLAVDKKQVLEDFGIPMVGNGEMDPVVPGKTDTKGDGEEPKQPGDTETESQSTKPGWQKGQGYADKISAQSIDAGAKLFQVDLARVLEDVRASNSPEEMKGRLLETFKGLPTEHLGRLLQRAAILARLDGRHSVLEDV